MTRGYFAETRPDIQRLIQARGGRFLDVGCGEGGLGAALKAAGASHVCGIESNHRAATEARARLDALLEGDVTEIKLPFEREEFDCLIFADVLEHLPSPERVIARLLPFLKRDGRVIASVPNIRFYLVLLRLVLDRWRYTDAGVRDRTHLRIFTRRSFEELLAAEDLVIERLERNYRIFEDQSQIGRAGALATRLAARSIAPWVFPDLMAFQYIAVARVKAQVAEPH